MKTHRDLTLPDPEEVKDIKDAVEYLKKLNQLIEENHLNVYHDIKELQP